MRLLLSTVLISLISIFASCTSSRDASQQSEGITWRKGNLHTHSLWSDGDDYPEMIISWYKERGYDFLALSDHNTMATAERWIAAEYARGGLDALQKYVAAFGADWVEQKIVDDTTWVRLKTFTEYQARFEEAGAFLMIKSEEITDGFNGKPVHVNATNLSEFIEPQGGNSLREVMQRNVDAVIAQREHFGIPMFPHINHPNFGWAMTAEDLMSLKGEQFFEVYNGHPAVHNYGDEHRPSMERIWDIILTRRLIHDQPIMYGVATDDSHNYHEQGLQQSNSGRAWVMVRSAELTPEDIVTAMEAGDFYGSTGVVLSDVRHDAKELTIQIEAVAGVTYNTEFIGTMISHDSTSVPAELNGAYITRQYSEEVGEVLTTSSGAAPVYRFTGDELYVRAKIISSRPKENPYQEGETEMAWTQPVIVSGANRPRNP